MVVMGNLFTRMIGTLAVLLVVAGFVGGREVLARLDEGRKRIRYMVLSGIMGGLLGIYGNLTGVSLSGSVVSIRDVGPMIAGFTGGPLGGIIAGIIAGIHRLTLGGLTAEACVFATCLIGLVCGFLSQRYRERIVQPKWSFPIGVIMECMHLSLLLIMVKPFETAQSIVQQVAIPFIFTNAFGFTFLTFFMSSIQKQRELYAERSRIQSELKSAATIQRSLLPLITERFPGREEISIDASINAAKEVGGDFYDLFFTGKDKLAIVIADVAGKGIPAALFMVRAKQTIQTWVRDIPDLSDAVTAANESLCENNEMEMFVTAWIGIIDISSGELRFVNAGHNPPVLITENGAEFVRGKHGFVMAGMEGYRYKEQTICLEPGNVLYLYTDGVTEAENEEHELFGDDRLLQSLNDLRDKDVHSIMDKVRGDISRHVNGFDQFDDITMMCMKYEPKQDA